MELLVVEGSLIKLPERVLKKFKGRKLELLEIEEGVLIKPLKGTIRETRGILKGSRISTRKYLEQKQKDKALEV